MEHPGGGYMHRGATSSDGGVHTYDSDLLSVLPDGKYGPPSLPAWFYETIKKMRKQIGTRDVFIVVDYVQKMYPLRKYGGDYERINIVMDELRKLSERIHGPVLVISEVNRESYKNPGMDAFKNSGRIEYAADVACILYEKRRTNSLREMELRMLKNRMGETAVIEFDFYTKVAKFEEVG